MKVWLNLRLWRQILSNFPISICLIQHYYWHFKSGLLCWGQENQIVAVYCKIDDSTLLSVFHVIFVVDGRNFVHSRNKLPAAAEIVCNFCVNRLRQKYNFQKICVKDIFAGKLTAKIWRKVQNFWLTYSFDKRFLTFEGLFYLIRSVW